MIKNYVNIVEAMENLVNKNVKHYKEDFLYDKDKLKEVGIGKYYFLTRQCGTWLFTENQMTLKNGEAMVSFFYYLDSISENAKSYVVDVKEDREGILYGEIKKVDYEKLKEKLEKETKELKSLVLKLEDGKIVEVERPDFNYYEILKQLGIKGKPRLKILEYKFQD